MPWPSPPPPGPPADRTARRSTTGCSGSGAPTRHSRGSPARSPSGPSAAFRSGWSGSAVGSRNGSTAPLWGRGLHLKSLAALPSSLHPARSRSMSAAREYLAGTAGVLAFLVGCGRGAPERPVIGVAYPSWSAPYIAEAESTLRRAWGDTATLPRFVFDTSTGPETADRVVT